MLEILKWIYRLIIKILNFIKTLFSKSETFDASQYTDPQAAKALLEHFSCLEQLPKIVDTFRKNNHDRDPNSYQDSLCLLGLEKETCLTPHMLTKQFIEHAKAWNSKCTMTAPNSPLLDHFKVLLLNVIKAALRCCQENNWDINDTLLMPLKNPSKMIKPPKLSETSIFSNATVLMHEENTIFSID